MSFFGGPRYGGGNQLFPQQFQQQVMQMQLQLQKNLQNLQNRPNQPNNTNNVKNNTDNAKGGKPGMSPNYNKGQNNSMKDSKTNVQNSTNNGPNKNVPNKKDNSNDINESNDKNSKSNVTPLMNISPEKLQDNKPPQPMQSILGKAPQFVKSDSQSNQNLSYETPQFQNRNQRGNFNSPYSHNSNPNRHNSSNRPQLNTPGQGRDFPKQQKNFYGQDRIKDKALQMFNGPQVDLPPMDTSEKKFNSFAKLFIGNLAKNTSQDELTNLFKKYGEINSVYLNKDSSFAFVQLDYKANAIKAQKEVDNSLLKGRNLKVRPATVSEGIKVKNLSPYVSNELLEKSFSVFGPVDSCRIMCDERGLSKGEGVLFFKDKKTAFLAIKKCQEECFFLSGALRPVIVSALDATDETTDGVPESSLPRNDEYHQERKIGPHFAEPNTFEFEFGSQWKSLFTMYDEKKSALDLDFQVEIGRLEKKMALAKVEYEAEQLRKQLAQREAESAELRRHFDGRRDAAGPNTTYPGTLKMRHISFLLQKILATEKLSVVFGELDGSRYSLKETVSWQKSKLKTVFGGGPFYLMIKRDTLDPVTKLEEFIKWSKAALPLRGSKVVWFLYYLKKGIWIFAKKKHSVDVFLEMVRKGKCLAYVSYEPCDKPFYPPNPDRNLATDNPQIEESALHETSNENSSEL